MATLKYEKSHQYCRMLTKEADIALYRCCMFLLPPKKRDAAFSLFAFYFFATSLQGKKASSGEKQDHIKNCQDSIERIFEHRRGEFTYIYEPVLEQTVARYGISKKAFVDLMSGVILQYYFRQPKTESELLHYCQHLKGSLGLILSQILGSTDTIDEPAMALGTAIELTSIARNIRQDLENKRIYFPKAWLEKLDIGEEEIFSLYESKSSPPSHIAQKLQELLMALCDLAHVQFAQGALAINPIIRDGSRMFAAYIFLANQTLAHKIQETNIFAMSRHPHLNVLSKGSLLLSALKA